MPEGLGPYVPRPIRFGGIWEAAGWRLKSYSISLPGERVEPKLWLAAQDTVRAFMGKTETAHTQYGIGFVTVHQGSGENQLNLDRWINENELLHEVWVSPPEDAMAFAEPPEDHSAMCVWEMYVQSFERHAWLAYVLNNPDGPDFRAYLSARLDEDV